MSTAGPSGDPAESRVMDWVWEALAVLPASAIRADIDALHAIAGAFMTGGGASHPFCCIFLVSGCPGVAPVWELVEGARNPNDNAVMMPFGDLVSRSSRRPRISLPLSLSTHTRTQTHAHRHIHMPHAAPLTPSTINPTGC